MPDEKPKRRLGRPPKIIAPIPDTLENVIKALIKPAKGGGKSE